jgi:hypothetical protein
LPQSQAGGAEVSAAGYSLGRLGRQIHVCQACYFRSSRLLIAAGCNVLSFRGVFDDKVAIAPSRPVVFRVANQFKKIEQHLHLLG